MKTSHLCFCLVLSLGACLQRSSGQEQAESSPPLRWWKGNLHTHSLWSDGDDFPEMIADWYAQRDYNFLMLSDHNVLSEGIRWMHLNTITQRADAKILDKYRARFGSAWVETRGSEGTDEYEIRLKPLNEFRSLVEQSGKFIMLQGEEISARSGEKPIHMNATNLRDPITPVGGESVREVMSNNLRLVLEQEQLVGREMLAHLNHPNFHYAVTADDLAHVIQEQFFEIHNGHPGVNQLGDTQHISIERMWDVVNAIRLSQLDAEPLMGIATDDSHEYHGAEGSRPGRGWVMVQSRYLSPEHLVRALKAGQFYASSGVVLSEIHFDSASKELSVQIEQDGDAQYETQFIATLRPTTPGTLPEDENIGKAVAVRKGLMPSFRMTDDLLYVRALIRSSLDPVDPSWEGQKQQAWTQPFGWQHQVSK